MITRESAEQLVNENNGVCPHCLSTLKIYRYKMNKQMASVLKKMREHENLSGVNVNFSDIDMPYRLQSQRTKMRLHGLIVQSVDAKGNKIANTWRITRKGYSFLAGQTIEETTVVFANQVIGHEGGLVTIGELTGEAGDIFEKEPITPEEASTYREVRTSGSDRKLMAQYKGRDTALTRFEEYFIKVSKLIVGQPITVRIDGTTGSTYVYRDLAAFAANWKVLKEVTA